MKKFLTTVAASMAILAVFGADPVTTVFNVTPPMHCAGCENKIKSNLRFEKGVKKVEASAETQEVTITYDPSKTDEEKLLRAFRKIGYDASCTLPDTSAPAEHEESAQ